MFVRLTLGIGGGFEVRAEGEGGERESRVGEAKKKRVWKSFEMC
jgi:hypothetical protein